LDEEIPSRGFATQFCVGVSYWSSVRIDNDLYYTTSTCLSEDRNDNSILFYFVFPSYRVTVLMRSGDVVCYLNKYLVVTAINTLYNQNDNTKDVKDMNNWSSGGGQKSETFLGKSQETKQAYAAPSSIAMTDGGSKSNMGSGIVIDANHDQIDKKKNDIYKDRTAVRGLLVKVVKMLFLCNCDPYIIPYSNLYSHWSDYVAHRIVTSHSMTR
jgi:hypothetical protein